MKKIIRKNCRRPFPFFNLPIPVLIKNTDIYIMEKFVNFTDSAMYYFDDDDQHDVNKLFGFSFGLHHNNSVRFGWRPNADLTKMEIVGYEYVNKVRIPTIPIGEVELNKTYLYQLVYNGKSNQIMYVIFDGDIEYLTSHPITLSKKCSLGYRLYLYFGGNKKAPHDIIIYLK
jgi:hypothetical protein